MFLNYFLKSSSAMFSFFNRKGNEQKPKSIGFALVVLMLLFTLTNMKAQTQLIPASDGAFNSGSTFAANGWTVANDGVGAVKWVVGNAVNSGAITGSSAYVSLDNGETNSYVGISGARTVFFYRDIVIPAGQTNIALSFNWKSVGGSGTTWQVFAAPTSYIPVGTDLQTTVPATLAGATSITYGSVNAVTQNAFGFIPSSFAGTTVRLIFMWTNGNGGGTNPPAAIDNISLVSRVGGVEIASVATGNFSNPATWDVGYVPSPADDVVINADHIVTIDNRNLGANNLYIAGANAVIQFGTISDEFTVNSDLLISGSGARFNVYEGTNGKSLKVGHNIDLASGGRLDVSLGNTGVGIGALTLFGSSLQTIASDGTGVLGGTVVSTTTTNTAGIINQLLINNTSTALPNIDWQLNNVRIKSILRLNNGKVALGSNKIYIGNFASMSSSNFTCVLGNGFIGGEISRWYTTSAMGNTIDPGIDYNPNSTVLFPFLSATGQSRWAFLGNSGATTAGELAIAYADATTMTTGLSVTDGSYTISDRFNGSWTVSKTGSTYVSAAGTYTLGLYAIGAYNALDGSSRVMNAATITAGAHINGTTTPFVVRKAISDADLTGLGAFYVGLGSASVQGAITKTSITSGDWDNAATWSPSGAPACSDVVTIASGHIVTVNSAGNNAAGVTIKAGGTLVNASGALTVGCTNNNAVFANEGTNTVSGGLLTVNGSVTHRVGSTLNHTGGDIVVDSNNGGDASTSVGQGGSSFKLNTSNLAMTGGKITIVDPLVNNTVATSSISGSDFTLTTLTLGTTGSFTHAVSGTFNAGATVLTMNSFNSNLNIFGVGQQVSGPGIQPGTTITAIAALINISITLSLPINATITSGTLTFSSMANGQYNIAFPTTGDFYSLAVGQLVSGPGIQPGTTIVTAGGGIDGKGGVTLSLPVSGLATSPIDADQIITVAAISSGCASVILSAANPAIIVGQAVAGTGIQPGTTVTAINGVKIDMSLPVSGAITPPVTLTFYDGNLNSYAFAYNAPVNYAAGLNHILQIGDGISTDKGAVTINGFYCNMVQGGGIFSLGNLTVDALDGTNRFFNAVNALFVQNTATVTTGSVFKKTNTTTGICFGGNVVNNGSIFVGSNPIYLASAYNTVTFSPVATSLQQTISGAGTFYNNLNPALATGSLSSLTILNTNPGGVTISIPNFRVTGSITMTSGIIHTSTATPLYHGLPDVSLTANISGNFSNTCFIDGPYSRCIGSNQTSASLYAFPVGKTSYTPIFIGVTGGAIFTGEAFTTNSGTASANISNLSAARWKVERVGALGSLSDFTVRLGNPSLAANNIIVQAPTDQGTYDNVLGNTATFATGTPNTLSTVAATPGASFTGNFAYATMPNCTTVNPGNTIADLTITQAVTLQNSSSTGIISGSAAVTLQTANTAIIVGLTVTGTGIPTGTTVAAISGTALTLSQPATVSSTSQTPLTFSNVQTPTTLCGTQTVPLSLQNVSSGAGITYQWQASTDGGSTYGDISGATATTYVAIPTANTYYRCTVTCPFGPVVVNSTPVQITFTNAIDSTTPAAICGSGVANLEATTSAGNINWYAAATGGTSLATGATYSPTVATTTTYYVAAESSSTYTAGKVFAGTTTQTTPFSGLVFNATTNVRLNSVKVYPKQTAGAADAGAPITIKLFDKNGVQVPGTTAVTFTPATNVGAISPTVSNTVVLDYNIPAGNGYKLLATYGLSSTNLIGKLSSFPASTPTATGAISITGSANTFDGTPDASYNNFFEWNVTEVCASPRVAVVATVNPVTTNTTTISACDTYTWSVNGSTYTTGGTYTSTVGCHTETLELTITPSTTNTTTISACDTYTWSVNGSTYTTGGTYTSTTGCNTETLELTIIPSTTNTTTISACDTYTWSVNGSTYTTGGTYTSTTGCHTEILELTITPSTTNTTTISACDTYTWSVNGSTYTTGGTYTSTVGCHTETLELTITPSTTNTTTISACNTYTWSVNGSTYTTGGTYTSTVGCHTETLELTINSAATPTGSAIQTISVFDANDATLEDLVVSPTNVTWYGSLADAQGQINPLTNTTVLTNGETYYAVNVSSGCSSTPFAVTVTVALSVNGFDKDNFKFYPNPTSGILNISYSSEITNVTVTNIVGQIVQDFTTNQNMVQIDLSSLPSSTYFVKVESNGKSKIIKVIKQN